MNEDINKEKEIYRKIGLYQKPAKKLLDLLDLEDHETILINLRVIPFMGIYKNGEREVTANHLILTTERIIFVNQGWVMKYNESVSYYEIRNILATIKWLISADVPVMIIKTTDNSYEIFFLGVFFKKKYNRINGIIECVKKRNPDVEIQMDLRPYTFTKDVLLTEVKLENPFKR